MFTSLMTRPDQSYWSAPKIRRIAVPRIEQWGYPPSV
jgi:hypothetical protein